MTTKKAKRPAKTSKTLFELYKEFQDTNYYQGAWEFYNFIEDKVTVKKSLKNT